MWYWKEDKYNYKICAGVWDNWTALELSKFKLSIWGLELRMREKVQHGG